MKFELGKTYLTYDGRKTRVICVDRKSPTGKCLALVAHREDPELEISFYYESDGHLAGSSPTILSDFSIVKEYKEPVYRWINVYKTGDALFDGANTYVSKEHAAQVAGRSKNVVGRIKFQLEERFDD